MQKNKSQEIPPAEEDLPVEGEEESLPPEETEETEDATMDEEEGTSEVQKYIEECGSIEELDKIQQMIDTKRSELEPEGSSTPSEFSTEEMP